MIPTYSTASASHESTRRRLRGCAPRLTMRSVGISSHQLKGMSIPLAVLPTLPARETGRKTGQPYPVTLAGVSGQGVNPFCERIFIRRPTFDNGPIGLTGRTRHQMGHYRTLGVACFFRLKNLVRIFAMNENTVWAEDRSSGFVVFGFANRLQCSRSNL